MHGLGIVGDACNVPYGVVVAALLVRCGFSLSYAPRLCSTCAQVDLYEIAKAFGRLLDVKVALFYLLHRHRDTFLAQGRKQPERLGGLLGCCGAMCDVSQLHSLELQDEFTVTFRGDIGDRALFNAFPHELVHACVFAREFTNVLTYVGTENPLQRASQLFVDNLGRGGRCGRCF